MCRLEARIFYLNQFWSSLNNDLPFSNVVFLISVSVESQQDFKMADQARARGRTRARAQAQPETRRPGQPPETQVGTFNLHAVLKCSGKALRVFFSHNDHLEAGVQEGVPWENLRVQEVSNILALEAMLMQDHVHNYYI